MAGELEFEAVIRDRDFKKSTERMKRQIAGVSDKAESESQRMQASFKKLGTVLAGVFTVAAATQFTRELINVRSQFEQLDVALTTILKSKTKANALMDQIKQLALETPFNLLDVAQGTKQLLAYGFQADQVTDVIKTLGNVAAGVSAPLGDIVYLYGTLRAQGRAYTKDLNQFTARGIPILEQLAKQFDITTAQVYDFAAAGKIGFTDVEKAFKSLTGQGGVFFNLMEKQSKTLQGQISNLQDQFDFMLNDLGQSSEGFISGAIGLASELVAHYEEILQTLGTIIAGYGAYKAAVIAVTVAERVHARVMESVALEMNLAKKAGEALTATQARRIIALKGLQAQWLRLNAVIAANPIGTVVVLLTGLLIAIPKVVKYFTRFNEELKKTVDATNEFLATEGKVTDLIKKYNKLKNETNRTAEETDKLRAISEQIAKLFPEEAGKLNQLTGAYDLNTAAIKKNLDAQNQQQRNDLLEKRFQLQQQIFKEQQAIDRGFYVAANGAQISFTDKALQNMKDNVSAFKGQLNDVNNLLLKLNGTATLTLPQKSPLNEQGNFKTAKSIETVSKRLGELRKQLADLQSQKKAALLPGAKADIEHIKDLDKQIKIVKADIKTLGGVEAKAGEINPEFTPSIDFGDLGKEIEKSLKESLNNISSDITDVGGDTMKKVSEKWKQGLATIKWFDNIDSANIQAEAANFFKSVFSDPFNDTLADLKKKIAEIDKVLSTGFFEDKFGNKIAVTPAQLESLQQVKQQLEGIAKTGDALWNRMRELPNIFNDMGQSVSGLDDGLSQAFDLMGGILTRAIDFKKSIDEAKTGFAAFGNSGGIGNLIGGIAGSLGAVGAVVGVATSVFSAIQKRQIELDKERAAVIKNQTELIEQQYEATKDLVGLEKIRAQSDAINKAYAEREKHLKNIIKLLKSAEDVKRGGLLAHLGIVDYDVLEDNSALREEGKLLEQYFSEGKWKAIGESIDKFLAANPDLNASIKASLNAIKSETELIKQGGKDLQEAFTGISLDSLTDDIVQMFEDGKASAEDFAGTFEDLMKGAILNTFKRQFLEQQLKGWYDEFSKLSQSDNKLTQAEINTLNTSLNTIVSNANKGLKQLESATGISFENPQSANTNEPTGLPGAIKGITSEQAGILAGQFNALRISQADATKAVRAQLIHLSAISANTRYNKHLESIDKKLDNLKADPLRATGSIH